MKLKKIKLNSFEENTLKDREMNQIRGGHSCYEGTLETCEELGGCNSTTTASDNSSEDSSTTPAN